MNLFSTRINSTYRLHFHMNQLLLRTTFPQEPLLHIDRFFIGITCKYGPFFQMITSMCGPFFNVITSMCGSFFLKNHLYTWTIFPYESLPHMDHFYTWITFWNGPLFHKNQFHFLPSQDTASTSLFLLIFIIPIVIHVVCFDVIHAIVWRFKADPYRNIASGATVTWPIPPFLTGGNSVRLNDLFPQKIGTGRGCWKSCQQQKMY